MKKNGPKKPVANVYPVILYSLKADRPRAATFPIEQAKKALELAAKQSFATIEVNTAELRKVAVRLTPGNLSAGAEAVPAVTLPIYNELIAATTLAYFQQGKLNPSMPASWEAAKAGDFIIAQESRFDGWYEALVLHRAGDMFYLKWLDYQKEPLFIRHLKAIALPSSAATATKAA